MDNEAASELSVNLPRFINIEPVFGCNQNCPICAFGASAVDNRGRPRLLTIEVLQTILDHLPANTALVNLYLFGEPLLHPELDQLVAATRSRGLAVTISTNGLLLGPKLARDLKQAGLKTLFVSFDGTSRERYSALRGKGYDRTIGNIEGLAAARVKDYPQIVLRTVVNHEREESIGSYLDMVSGLGIVERVAFHTFSAWPRQNLEAFLPLPPSDSKVCCCVGGPLNVLTDGRATPCGYDINGELATVSILDQKVADALICDSMREFRTLHLAGDRARIPLCSDCEHPNFAARSLAVSMAEYGEAGQESRGRLWHEIACLQEDR